MENRKGCGIEIPENVGKILDRLAENGYCGYIVGGCTRDFMLGIPPHDFDICTDCQPDQMKEVFSDFHTFDTGLKHGTLTVLSDGEPVEVTTFRSDGEYVGHRKPKAVTFEKSLSADLQRRDFTINAICADRQGRITDLFHGEKDIQDKIIRCVGDPRKRFEEDALRIMRAVRFAATLGFEIEKDTAAAMYEKSHLLREISAERIYSELSKLLCGENAVEVLLRYRDIFTTIIPELTPTIGCQQSCPHHSYDVYEHICRSVGNIRPERDLRLCMLLHDIEKPKMKKTDSEGVDHFKKHPEESAATALKIMERLKCSVSTRKRVFNLITEHDNRIPVERRSVRRFAAKYGYEFIGEWLEVRRADDLAKSTYLREKKLGELDGIAKIAEALRAENCCINLNGLAVSGEDMKLMGFKGKQIGVALNAALDGVIDEKIPNEKPQIEDYLRRVYIEKV